MPMTEAQRKADKKYREINKILTFAIAYKKQDIEQGQRLKKYLTSTGESANSYIKKLIKDDLDRKGFTIDIDDTGSSSGGSGD